MFSSFTNASSRYGEDQGDRERLPRKHKADKGHTNPTVQEDAQHVWTKLSLRDVIHIYWNGDATVLESLGTQDGSAVPQLANDP